LDFYSFATILFFLVVQESRTIVRKPCDAACFPTSKTLFDCYLLQLTKGQDRQSFVD